MCVTYNQMLQRDKLMGKSNGIVRAHVLLQYKSESSQVLLDGRTSSLVYVIRGS